MTSGLRGAEALAAILGSSGLREPGARRHKYGVAPASERTDSQGEVFDSKAEMERHLELLELRRIGVVLFHLRQVPFHLPGRTRYRVDFLVFWADGHQTFEDVKGARTATYELKRRQVADLYGVSIVEVRRPRRRRSPRRARG